MTIEETIETINKVIDELKMKHRPDEGAHAAGAVSKGALGFDYGYQTALNTVSISLLVAFVKPGRK